VLQHMNQNLHVYSGNEANLLTQNESSGGSDVDELLSFMCKDHEQDDKSANSELAMYLSDHSTTAPLLYWAENKNKYPRLYGLHLNHHCVVCTGYICCCGKMF
jgi:hypothetical protein